MRTAILTCTLAALLLPSPVLADSCLPELLPTKGVSGNFTLATLNRNGLASYGTLAVTYYKGFTTPNGGAIPARWLTPNNQPSKQYFSNRFADQAGTQPFSATNTDLISISVTVAAAPNVKVTLNSHHNGVSSFTATCSPGGVMHGVADGVDFLLLLGAAPTPQY